MPSWPGIDAADRGFKRHLAGGERTETPATTLERVRAWWPLFGITRVANLTGLDHLGIPVAAAYRPHARAFAVSQGKGVTLEAAKASAVMESIETFHSESMTNPLRVASLRQMSGNPDCVQIDALPRLNRALDPDQPMLWVSGRDLSTGREVAVPWEIVHTDYTISALGITGAFMCSSNGLASGNHFWEAVSHGICEVVERDANTLCDVASRAWRAERRVDLTSLPAGECRDLIDRIEGAGALVAVWETTSDVAIASFACTLADSRPRAFSPVIPMRGSGCHPRREIALVRAVTEAAQGRATRIAATREDLSPTLYAHDEARLRNEEITADIASPARRAFSEAPSFESTNFADDVAWEMERLATAGLPQIAVVDLTRADLRIPVVRVIIPGLEGPYEIEGRLPGRRQLEWQRAQRT
jgi:ribosomal protein S12 methylthiotransferase accessory factor